MLALYFFSFFFPSLPSYLFTLSFLLSLYRFLSFPISCSKCHYIFIFAFPQTVYFILFSVTRSLFLWWRLVISEISQRTVCISLLFLPSHNQWIWSTITKCLTTHYSNFSVYELNYFSKLIITRNRGKRKLISHNFPRYKFNVSKAKICSFNIRSLP